MTTKDGKIRRIQMSDTEGILRIIQSISSPKAEPFKGWLARVGSETIVGGIQDSTNEIQSTSKGIFGSIGIFAIGGFMESIGFVLTIAGGIMLFIAHRREITAYTAQQMIPVGKEIVEEVAPTIGHAAGEIAKGIKQGINEANNEIK